MPTDRDIGLLTGLLIGEGHFGGDGKQPHITLRMHVRHEALFHWIQRTFPGGKLYGPYLHGGRNYFQWMARGPYLRDQLVPLLNIHLTPELDAYAHQRFRQMCKDYTAKLSLGPAVEAPPPKLPEPEDTVASLPGPGDTGEHEPDPADALFSRLRTDLPK